MNQLSEILLLVTEGGKITGITTERDYLRRVTLQGRTDKDTAVREIMSSPLIMATSETPIDEWMALMTDRRIGHVPVVDGGEVVGVVSIGELANGSSRSLRLREPRHRAEGTGDSLDGAAATLAV